MKTINKKTNLNNINSVKLKEELEILSEAITNSLNGPLHTTLSYIRKNPVLPEFLIEAMDLDEYIRDELETVYFGCNKPNMTEYFNTSLNLVEENDLTRSFSNLYSLVEYLDEDSELEKIAISYFDSISLSKENQNFHNSYVTAAEKSEDNKITEYRFNKTEKDFTNDVLSII